MAERGDASQTCTMYCVRCKTMVGVQAPVKVTLKTNRSALQGNCPHCKTKTFKITKLDA